MNRSNNTAYDFSINYCWVYTDNLEIDNIQKCSYELIKFLTEIYSNTNKPISVKIKYPFNQDKIATLSQKESYFIFYGTIGYIDSIGNPYEGDFCYISDKVDPSIINSCPINIVEILKR